MNRLIFEYENQSQFFIKEKKYSLERNLEITSGYCRLSIFDIRHIFLKNFIRPKYMETPYKKPNPNFSQELCAFLSQSKHQKQEQIQSINQDMIEQFVHLFEICNINRYIEYTKEFIDEIRKIILRLQIVQKIDFELLDQNDQFMYLIIEGRVQKIMRQKPQPAKRIIRFNMTACKFGSSAINSNWGSLNTRASHQFLNNMQLKEFQKSLIINRNSRMSMLSGNLLSQLAASPRKRNKTQDCSNKFTLTYPLQRNCFDSPFKAKSWRFRQKIQQQPQNSIQNSSTQSNESKQIILTQKVQILQPLENEIYHCLTPVKYIRLLKWSYDQLVQYVYKYQNDQLIHFLAKSLNISEGQIKIHQIYNKTNYNYFQERESRHSNQCLKLNTNSIYLIRQGSIELKYVCPYVAKKCPAQLKTLPQIQKNPNLADYINQTECSSKKIVLNQGSMIFPELQKNKFYVQSLSTVVFIQINHKLVQYLKAELKDNWWGNKFQPSYKKLNQQRAIYMKDELISVKQQKCTFHMQNVFIQTKKRKFHSAKYNKARFRAGKTDIDEQNKKIFFKKSVQNITISSSMKKIPLSEQQTEKFDAQYYKEFISLLPYNIMIKSKQKISAKLNQKSKAKHISDKFFCHIKKNKIPNATSKHKNKVLQLKMKNIASKQIKIKDLNIIYDDINNNTGKKQFHKSLKGNWFKQQHDQNNLPGPKLVKQSSHSSNEANQSGFLQRSMKPNKATTHIIALNRKFQNDKRKFTVNTLQSIENDQRKVTFALNNSNGSDDSSEEEYLCDDDTGLIKKFVQNSHNYQKQIPYLIKSSQRQDRSHSHKKKKLKTCKTEGNNLLFSHNLINDILRRVNPGAYKPIAKSNKTSEKASDINSKCQSMCASQRQNIQQKVQKEKEIQKDDKSDSNVLSYLFSQFSREAHRKNLDQKAMTQDTIQKQQVFHQRSTNCKQNKTHSFTNNGSSKSSSCKLLTANNRVYILPVSMYNRFTVNSNKENKQRYTQSSFFQKKCKRPMTASAENIARLECKSLMFNQWIETESTGIQQNQQRSSQWGSPSYNFCEPNISSGDKKIWKRLKSGKIVKKSVKYYNSPHITQQKNQKSIEMAA